MVAAHLTMVIGEYGYKKHKDVKMELMETMIMIIIRRVSL